MIFTQSYYAQKYQAKFVFLTEINLTGKYKPGNYALAPGLINSAKSHPICSFSFISSMLS